MRPFASARLSSVRSFLALDLLDNRYPTLHGMRVIAILSIIIVHVTSIFNADSTLAVDEAFSAMVLHAFFGMDLFFILSGFLIGSILLRSLADHGTQNIRRFYLRRVFRTFPSYYVVLTALALSLPLTLMQRKHLWVEYVYGTNMVSLRPDSIVMGWGWSLALEEQFYLAVPLLFFVLHRLNSNQTRLGLLTLLWSSALVVRAIVYFRGVRWTEQELAGVLYFRTHARFDTLIAGIIVAFLHANYKTQVTGWLSYAKNRAILAVTALLCLRLLMEPGFFGQEQIPLFRVFAWGTVTSVMYGSVLVLLLHRESLFSTFLGRPIFRQTATLGYGVYLVHIPLCKYVMVPLAHGGKRLGMSNLALWPSSVLVLFLMSLAVGYVMHILIEKPSLRIRDWLAR
jgi:peptidoglycan/LPS O-acetylase OafA/YrhL